MAISKTAVFTLIAALLLAGCAAGAPGSEQRPGQATVRNELHAASNNRAAELPPEVAAALLPPLQLSLPEPLESRFDIDVHEVKARDFFVGLVRGSADNMVVHPAVSGTISLQLRNVTVAETMEMVRDVYGYDYRRVSTGWQVFPAALQSRLFKISYLSLQREGSSETRVSSGQMTQPTQDAGNGAPPAASSRIVTTSRSDFWDGLEASLRVIIGLGEEPEALRGGRAVLVNPHSGVVMVRAMPGELREVEAFLAEVQGNAARQVILEAKILEVELSDGFQSGINWAALVRARNNNTIVGGMTGGGTIFDSGLSEIAGQTGNLNPLNRSPVEGNLTSAFGGVFSAAVNFKDFTAFIELLKAQGDVQVLSSPRVATVNNQKALIKVGTDEYFITDVSFTTETEGTVTRVIPSFALSPFFSGIALDVMPTIAEDGMVTLHIRPSVTEVVDQIKSFTVMDQIQTLPLAFSTVRESDTVVRALNGQIVVIGGLMQDIQRQRQAGIPGLSSLPGVGRLFRHEQLVNRKTELVILLRPLVVDSDQVWAEAAGLSERRVGDIHSQRARMQ